MQLAHPVIWSILALTTAVEGGAGKPVGVGVGVGLGVVPLTVRLRGALKTAPVESQA